MDPPKLVPFGERFGIIASGSLSLDKRADVAVVSWRGVDDQEEFALTELCPDICRNVHGRALLGGAAGGLEFLLAEQGSAESMPAYPLRLMVWHSGRSEAAITPLFDARVTAITTRADMQSSRDAARALFVIGNIDSNALDSVEIAAGGVLVAPPSVMTLPSLPWECLSVVPTDEAGAISVVARAESASEVVWSVRELDADANVRFETSARIPAGDALGYTGCPLVIESPEGFHAQWVSDDGALLTATLARDAGEGAPPALFVRDVNPGALQASFQGKFLFRAQLDDGRQGFVKLNQDGGPAGAPIVLPVIPESTLEHRRALPSVLRVEGARVFVSYELESERVFEQLDCGLAQ